MVLDQAVSALDHTLSQSRESISLEHGCLDWHKLWLSSRDITCPNEKAESHPCALRELKRRNSETIAIKTILLSQVPRALNIFFLNPEEGNGVE